MAMLACARLGAVHSVVFGGFAANELATRIDDCSPKLVLTASCGIEPGRIVLVQAVARPGDRACPSQDPALHRLPAPAGAKASLVKGRDLDWNEAVAAAEAARLRAGEGDRPALHPLHLGHDRPAQGRGARQWRLLRGARLVDAIPLRHRSRRGVVVRLRRGLGGGPQLHRLRPADPWRDHDPLRGQAGRHARRRRLLARDLRAQGGGAVHRAHRLPRHQEGGPRGQAAEDSTTSRNSARLFLAGERGDPPTIEWAQKLLGVPIVDHWWQTETGWAICGNFVGLEPMPIKPGSCSVPAPGWQLEVLDEQGNRIAKPGEVGALAAQAAAAAGHLPDAVERRRALQASLPRGLSRLLQDGRCGLHRPATATSR